MTKTFLSLALCLMITASHAQSVDYTQAEKFMKNKTGSWLGTVDAKPMFWNDGSDKFFYTIQSDAGWVYYFVDPVKKTNVEFFTQSWIEAELSKITGRKVARPRFTISNPGNDHQTFILQYDKYECVFDFQAKTLTVQKDDLPVKPNSSVMCNNSPDSAYCLYLENFNLYVQDLKTSEKTPLTDDGEFQYTYSGSDWKGVRFNKDPFRQPARGEWFSDSKHFFIIREDTRKLQTMPIIDLYGKRPKVEESDYIMTGDEFVPQSELWIFNAETQTKKRVDIDKWQDQIVKIIPYKNDLNPKKYLYFTREKRTRDEIELCRVTPAGEVTVLINEVSKPFLSDEFFNITILNEGKDIIWWSERTGWGHYYLYDENGKLVNAITSGEWVAGKILNIDEKKRMLYVESYGQVKGEAPYFKRATGARFDGKKQTILTPEMATHEVEFSPSMKYIIDNYSRADLEPVTVLRDSEGKPLMEIYRPNLSKLHETGWKAPEPFTAKAADNQTDLYGYMWKPYNFDPNKKYPIISYVYPGPQTDHFPLTFSVSANYNAALAQLGFIVVNFGHRGGTPMRDKAYHSYSYKNIRDYPLADDKYVLEQLAQRHAFIDSSKVGIFGHSGGGFMAAAAILTYPDFYKAAVSASGNHDNSIYFKAFAELYHGVEEKNTGEKTVFETGQIPTTMELAKNLKGHLMLVTGDKDNNVHPAHTMRLARALINAGKNFELVVLPGSAHVYSGKNNDFFERKMWLHFAKYLLEDFESEKIVDF